MNPRCMECDVPNGVRVLRSAKGDWLMLGDDCYGYTPDGRRLRMSEVPKAFDGSKPERIVLTIVMGKHTPRCLCQVCAKGRARTPKVKQRDFFSLVEGGETCQFLDSGEPPFVIDAGNAF